MESESQAGFKWPKLNNAEMIEFYNKIKQDKILTLSWTNPGRMDPVEYEKLHSKESQHVVEDVQIVNTPEKSLQDDNEIEQFDLFDELATDEFNSNQILKLTHVKTSRDSDKKMASMDKILDDMRKNYEYEQKNNVVSHECIDLVNNEQILPPQDNEHFETVRETFE